MFMDFMSHEFDLETVEMASLYSLYSVISGTSAKELEG